MTKTPADWGFPYAEVQFDIDGRYVDPQELDHAIQIAGGVTDVLVISHGWNNDMTDARALYEKLSESMHGVLEKRPPAGYGDRTLAMIGVLWPSKKFADTDVIPGGAASLDDDPTAATVHAELTQLAALLETKKARKEIAEAAKLIGSLETAPGAGEQFLEHIRAALANAPGGAAADGGPAGVDPEDASRLFFEEPAGGVMASLGQPVFGGGGFVAPDANAGGAAGLDDIVHQAQVAVGKVTQAARKAVNYATYYAMKARSGVVGSTGGADLLAHLLAPPAADAAGSTHARVHLAGHSFGARVVCSAAVTVSAQDPVSSMTLLQGAFSHYGLAEGWDGSHDGLFRTVLKDHRVSGPVMVTHTKNDTAVGIAYALASAIAGQVAAGLGDENDKYGGLGRNGALKTPEAVLLGETLLDVDGSYTLAPGALHNLNGDQFISSHGDVRGPQVAFALLSAIAVTGA